MAKPLPKEDFRALRIVLESDDFALSSETPDPPPRDLVTEDTWQELVQLPDDVAIRTSNDYGRILKEVSDFKNELMSVLSAVKKLVGKTGRDVEDSPMCHVLFVAYEDFQASIYNALTGYYRVAFSALRDVVENVTVGLHLTLLGDRAQFRSWLNGGYGAREYLFGWAADKVSKHKAVHELESHLTAVITDDLFHQKVEPDPGGFARRLFGNLSQYAHGRPGFTHGDIWASNGPVFVEEYFFKWAICFIQVYGFCLIACRLAQPGLTSLDSRSKLTLEELFKQAARRLVADADGAKLFQHLPPNFW